VVAISPAAIPEAAIENPSLPPHSETVAGNAALLHLRATTLTGNLNTETAWFRKQLEQYRNSPAKDFPFEDARKDVAGFENALNELRPGSRRQTYEWQFPIEESRTQI
jgi:hypothetical protein